MTKASAWRWGAPRLIIRDQLLAYLSMEEPELQLRMKQGRVPGPIWGTAPALPSARWDRHAIDRALDRAAGLQCSVEAAIEDLDRDLGLDKAGNRQASDTSPRTKAARGKRVGFDR